MIRNHWLGAFLLWRRKHISNKNFVFFLSIVIGIIGGLAAVLLKTITHFIDGWLTAGFDWDIFNYLYFLYPLIGIFLTVAFIYFFNRNKLGHGITNVLYTISKKGGNMEPDKMYSHLLTGAMTVGFGGSVGLEAPIVTTGSAFASNLARLFRLGYKQKTLLIGCGAAAATSAIFNSPITGVIFAMEILLLELTVPSFIPILLSSITATIVSKLLLGEQILFAFELEDPFLIEHVPLYIILGILAGLYSVYFTSITIFVENTFARWNNRFLKALIGSAMLGVLLFFFPPLFGEGYGALKDIMRGDIPEFLRNSFFYDFAENPWMVLLFVGLIILVKVFAVSFTTGAGGNGGIFAPSIFVGGLLGFSFARIINLMNLSDKVSEVNFALVGITGIISGVMHAPLTGIFLVLEITSSYELIIPLMTVSVIAYATIKYVEPYSIYASQLARKGHDLAKDKDKEVLTLLRLKEVIEKDLTVIHPEETLGELVKIVAESTRNIFPVVDDKDVLQGIVTLDDIRGVMFDSEKYDSVLVKDLMHQPPGQVEHNETMQEVMQKFDDTGAWNLPVIKNGVYIGFLSKARIFSAYRELLIDQSKPE